MNLDQQRMQPGRQHLDLRRLRARRGRAEDHEPAGARRRHRRRAVADRAACRDVRRVAAGGTHQIVSAVDSLFGFGREIPGRTCGPVGTPDAQVLHAAVLGDRADHERVEVDVGLGTGLLGAVVIGAGKLSQHLQRHQRGRDGCRPAPGRSARLPVDEAVGPNPHLVLADPRRAIAVVAKLQDLLRRRCAVQQPVFHAAVASIAGETSLLLVPGLVGEAQADLDDGERRTGRRFARIEGLGDLAARALAADRGGLGGIGRRRHGRRDDQRKQQQEREAHRSSPPARSPQRSACGASAGAASRRTRRGDA